MSRSRKIDNCNLSHRSFGIACIYFDDSILSNYRTIEIYASISRSTKYKISCKIEKILPVETMLTAVEEIESAILKLSPQDVSKLTEWVLDLDEQNWDRQIERDVALGKLDFLAKEALDELESSDSRML